MTGTACDVSLPTFTTSGWTRRIETSQDALDASPIPPLRIVFAGGGTGGHLYPAIAIARTLLQQAPESAVTFVGSDRPLERRILEPTGFPYVSLPTAPWPGLRRPWRGLRFAWQQVRGVLASRRLLRDLAPQVVVGLGGFPSFGPVVAARTLGVPVALFEPNAIPGLANRVLARLAREAYVQWDGTRIACSKVHSGAPLDARALPGQELTPADARARLDLPLGRPTVLVMGGSQGSRAINAWIASSLAELGALGEGLSFIHLCGDASQAPQLRRAYERAGCAHHVATFLPEIGVAYRAADLAVVRGGGATLAELLAAGLPGLVVPMPGSAGDHQRHNAEAFASTGAGMWIDQERLDPVTLRWVVRLVRDEERLLVYRAQARLAGFPESARVVVRRLAKLADTHNRWLTT